MYQEQLGNIVICLLKLKVADKDNATLGRLLGCLQKNVFTLTSIVSADFFGGKLIVHLILVEFGSFEMTQHYY